MQNSGGANDTVDDHANVLDKTEWTPEFKLVKRTAKFCRTRKCVIRIVSQNILARRYTHPASFATSPPSSLNWEYRSRKLLRHLLSLDGDVLCLQELDEYENFFKPAFQEEGYQSIYLQRLAKGDGCGIFFKGSKFMLLTQHPIDYDKIIAPKILAELQRPDWKSSFSGETKSMLDVQNHYKLNCVALVAVLRCTEAPRQVIMVVNTHLYFDPVLMQVKLAQAQYLGEQLVLLHEEIHKKLHEEPLVVIVGDFNSQPHDEVYKYMTGRANSGKHLKWKKIRKLGKKKYQSNVEIPPDVLLSDTFPLPLASLYDILDQEPFATNLTYKFQATLDYIFFMPDRKWKPVSFLKLPPPFFLHSVRTCFASKLYSHFVRVVLHLNIVFDDKVSLVRVTYFLNKLVRVTNFLNKLEGPFPLIQILL